MRIIFDNIIYHLQPTGGISVVWYELLRRAALDPTIEATYLDYESENLCRRLLNLPMESVKMMPTRWMERYRSPQVTPSDSDAVFHSSYFRTLPGARNITTVHDLTYHMFRRGLPKQVHLWQEAAALRQSTGVICVSENTRRDLLRLYPWLREEDVRVVYNGVADYFEPTAVADTDEQGYLLFVGDRVGYKNFGMAVEVARLSKMHLKIVGAPLSAEEKALLDNKLPASGYSWHDRCPNQQLNYYYNRALALLYPSLYEGFGIPVLEAQKAGCPVLALNTSSIPEVAGEAALLYDPTKVDAAHAMADDLLAMLSGRIERQNLVERGRDNAARFSWDKTYSETRAFYQEIANR